MPAGRPSKYDPEIHPIWAWGMAIDGLTMKEIAKEMEVTEGTLYEWKKNHSEFSEAIKKGKDPTDNAVEQSLLKRAVGYMVTETTKIAVMGKDGKPQPVRVQTVERHIPADTAAAFIWLKNRRPGKWRDRQPEAADNGAAVASQMVALAELINKPRPDRALPGANGGGDKGGGTSD